MSGGILTAYILGTFFSWYNLAWTCCGAAGEFSLNWFANFFHYFMYNIHSVFNFGDDLDAPVTGVVAKQKSKQRS